MKDIHIKDKNSLKEKIEKIKEQGKDNLHIVTDFDRTLTKAIINGKKIPSSYGLLRESHMLSNDYSKKSYALFDRYYPYEIDNTLPIEEKSKMMMEWWTTHLKLIKECGMHKDIIKKITQRYNKVFREYVREFFELAKEENIPVLIFSAGIGGFILEYLEKENILDDNIHLIANFFEYDKEGNVTGYVSDIVHSFNKSEIQLENKEYKKDIEEKKNIILLGDSLGDLGMTEGIKYENIIKIGFLNDNIKENLEIYKESFDVVITDDSTFEYPVKILKEIL